MTNTFWKRSFALVAFLFWIDFCSSAQDLGLDPQVVGDVEIVEITNPDIPPTESNESIYWSHLITRLGSKYMRLRFTVDSEPAVGDATLRVSTFSKPNAFSISIDASLRGASFWTPPINAQRAEVTIVGSEAPAGVKLKLDRIAYTTQTGKLSSIIGLDQRQPIWSELSNPLISRLHSSVAKLSFVVGKKMYVCTGFMVDESTLVTNEHCVNSQEICDSTTVIFGYQELPDGNVSPGSNYSCSSFIRANFDLDYALLAVAGNPGATWGHVAFSGSSVSAGESLFVIQHPAGEPKQVSIQDCSVSQPVADGRARGTDFAHTCDTLGGSSGSPIFTLDGRLVGLHHYGRGVGFWNENRAVRISQILDGGS